MSDTQQSTSAGANGKTKRSRITAACAVCRAKRQKCSGEKPVCDQCRIHNEECWWSDQKKRGPAKDYLRSLQDRLQEAERLLLGVLDKVSDADLADVVQGNAADPAASPSHQTWLSALSGPDYWTQYPLSRVDAIRSWQEQRANDPQIRAPQRADGASSRTAARQPAPEANMRPSSAHMPTHADEASNGQYPFYQNGFHGPLDPSLQDPLNGGTLSHERRYSEETRGVAEALFSISTHGDAASRQSEAQAKDAGGGEPQHGAKSSPTSDALPEQFPKHLFW